jgi:predicted protein tyrosine phosphatase
MKRIGIQVFGEAELIKRIRQGKPHYSHCISIRNPGELLSQEIQGAFRKVLELSFYDQEDVEHLPEDVAQKRIPEIEDVERVIAFVRQAVCDPDLTGFTIHCRRGISRSAAIALGILYMILKDEERATKHLIKIRAESMPHTGIVRMFDSLLGANLNSYRAKIHRYRLKQMFTRLGMSEGGAEEPEPDYIDELELFD